MKSKTWISFFLMLALVLAGTVQANASPRSAEALEITTGNRRMGADIVLLYNALLNPEFTNGLKSVYVNDVLLPPDAVIDQNNGQLILSADHFPTGDTAYDIRIVSGAVVLHATQYVVGLYNDNLLVNGDMSELANLPGNGWNLETANGASVDVTFGTGNDAGAQRFRFPTVESLGTNPRDVQLYQDVMLESGRLYTLYVTARSNPARSIALELGNGLNEPFGGIQIEPVQNVGLTTQFAGQVPYTTYAFTIDPQEEDGLVRLNLLLGLNGTAPGGNRDVFIREIRLVETIHVPVWTGSHAALGGWWVLGNAIINSNDYNGMFAQTAGIGSAEGNQAFMDMDLLEMPGARLHVETTGSNAISGLMIRSDVNSSGSPQVDRITSGQGVNTGNNRLAVFEGEALIGAAWSTFGVGSQIALLTVESGNANANRFTITNIYLTHDDIPVDPDTVLVGIEMANPGKTAYQLGENLDLSETTIYKVYESGRKEEVQVTPEMLVGFATAVTSEARRVTVVYPDTFAALAHTTEFFISIEGESTSLPAQMPFPMAGNNPSLAVDLLLPTGVTQEQMNQAVIDRFLMMIDAGEFLIDPPTATDPENFRMVLNHNASGTTGGIQVTCSESMGYGMVILAKMAGADELVGIDVQAYFDGMVRSVQHWPTTVGANLGPRYLMAWELVNDSRWKNQPFRHTGGSASTATDGSIDMAYAMLLAHAQWGSEGRYDYLAIAKRMINEIFHTEVHPTRFTLTRGNWDRNGNFTRPSDHIMYALKAFAYVDTNNDWQRVIDVTYAGQLQLMNLQSPVNGLLPDFADVRPANGWIPSPPFSLESAHDGDYHWNACRVPWRLAVDEMFSGTTPVSDYAVRLLNENTRIWSGGDFTRIFGRQMNGAINDTAVAGYDVIGSCFSAPFVVTSAIHGPQEWFDAGWDYVANLPWEDNQYGDYIVLLSMIAASGNEWSPTPKDAWLAPLEGIELETAGRLEYLVGEELDLDGFTIQLIFGDERQNRVIPVTPEMISGFSSEYVGEVVVTITYGEFTASFTVSIAEPPFPIERLKALVAEILYLELDPNDYTDESWALFQAALEEVVAYLEAYVGNEPLSIDLREGLYYALREAFEALVLYVPTLIEVIPSARVTQLNGNTNDLHVTVTRVYSRGPLVEITETFNIRNNASGNFTVDGTTVFVNTQGNTQIREIRVVN